MSLNESGNSFFHDSDFNFAKEEESVQKSSVNHNSENTMEITLLNPEVKKDESVDGLIKLNIAKYLDEGYIYMYYSVSERSEYKLSEAHKLEREANHRPMESNLIDPNDLVVKTYEDDKEKFSQKTLKNSNNLSSKGSYDGLDGIQSSRVRKKMISDPRTDIDSQLISSKKRPSLYTKSSNKILPVQSNKNYGSQKSRVSRFQKLKNIFFRKPEPIQNRQHEYESATDGLNETHQLISPNRDVSNGMDAQFSTNKVNLCFEKLIKVYHMQTDINRSALVYIPFRINLENQKKLFLSSSTYFVLSDSKEKINMSQIEDYFKLLIIHNIKFAYLSENLLRRYDIDKTTNLTIKEFKSFFQANHSSEDLFHSDKEYNLIPNTDNVFKQMCVRNYNVSARLKKLACLPFTRKCPVQISVDRTIINNTTKHLNISFRYPMHVTLNFEFLEIVLLMRFSSKYSPHIHKELALLCEYINLQKSFIPKKMKDLEFVHKFNIERLQSTNLHSIEVI